MSSPKMMPLRRITTLAASFSLTVAVAACTVDFDPNAVFTCDDDSECADGYVCCPQGTGESVCRVAEACVIPCGNDAVDPGEDCDGADLDEQTCTTLPGAFSGGTLACNATCQFDTTACELPLTCGDGILDGGEDCDGTNLGTGSCTDLGFTGGTLACSTACAFDTSSCFTCGDGVAETGESCDGQDLASSDCTSIGMGFVGGTLACAGDCSFDVSACDAPPNCGNGVIDASEECDGTNLNGGDCMSEGFDGGTLACSAGCVFVTTGCATCGNSTVEMGEDCDGMDLGGATCGSLMFDGGTLACTAATCMFDTSGCTDCGNNMIESGELCDGTDLNGMTCADRPGWGAGTLACNATCDGYDESGCTFCDPGQLYCDTDGRTVQSCNAAGTGPTGIASTCEFVCADDECKFVSNIAPGDIVACDTASAAVLNPALASEVSIAYNAMIPEITCAGPCDTIGGGSSTIAATLVTPVTGGPPVALFCLQSVNIGSTNTLVSEIDEAIVFFSDDSLTIDAPVDLAGGTGGPQPGPAGSGGLPGGGTAAGMGDAPGAGGGTGGTVGSSNGGGGGGGAYGGTGGDGGDTYTSAVGGVGGSIFGTADIRPLEGGCGGGGGYVAMSPANGGGGGGGGALHLVSRTRISLGGTIFASGGPGSPAGGSRNGSGGGGSGGAILIEAPIVDIAAATLLVEGGTAGPNSSGAFGCPSPGLGAMMTMPNGTDGGDGNGSCEGGAGGGGGGGRVRVNAAVGMCDATVSPTAACTAGPLRTGMP